MNFIEFGYFNRKGFGGSCSSSIISRMVSNLWLSVGRSVMCRAKASCRAPALLRPFFWGVAGTEPQNPSCVWIRSFSTQAFVPPGQDPSCWLCHRQFQWDNWRSTTRFWRSPLIKPVGFVKHEKNTKPAIQPEWALLQLSMRLKMRWISWHEGASKVFKGDITYVWILGPSMTIHGRLTPAQALPARLKALAKAGQGNTSPTKRSRFSIKADRHALKKWLNQTKYGLHGQPAMNSCFPHGFPMFFPQKIQLTSHQR